MFITGTTDAAGAATQGAAPSSSPLPTDQLGRDTFLKLMVAQLRNQDPMNPTDSAEFLAQTAQFTSLEKLEAVADQSAQALSAQMAFGATSLVGRTVSYTDPATGSATGDTSTGSTDGSTGGTGGSTGTEAPVTGVVQSVRFTADGPLLTVGDTEIPLSAVLSVTPTP
jgi:flagellar basal-body rod modification protein FlgD